MGKNNKKEINKGPRKKSTNLKMKKKNPQTKTTKSEDSSQFNLGWVWRLALVGFG